MIAAHAERPMHVDRHMAEVAGNPGSAVQDHAVNHGGAPDTGPKRQQHDIATSARRSPKHLGQQRDSSIIVGAHRKIRTDEVAENTERETLRGRLALP
jgi:peptidoglycan/xylan/chitin deacetylase (PgdA/CDA1 family)